MKKILILCFVLFSLFRIKAQEQKLENEFKINGVFLPIAILNFGYERAITEHWSGQVDLFISPWNSFAHNYLQTYMGHLEGRYYFNRVFSKWYVGGNVGLGLFNIQKWNYWNTDKLQRGFNIMVGGVVGYQFSVSEGWNLDVFLRGGTSQGFYHGYYIDNDNKLKRYDDAKGWNKSGELIPYGGGVMLSYKF